MSLSLLKYFFDHDHGDLLAKAYVHLLNQFASNLSIAVEDAKIFYDSDRS